MLQRFPNVDGWKESGREGFSFLRVRSSGKRREYSLTRRALEAAGIARHAGEQSYQNSVSVLLYQERADGQNVHAGALEAVDGFFGRADDGLVLVKAGVEDHGNSGLAMKS